MVVVRVLVELDVRVTKLELEGLTISTGMTDWVMMVVIADGEEMGVAESASTEL
jgi:hypothetical protein